MLHELGHAIPAILFTRKKVKVYIGSIGNPRGSIKINIGLLEMWIRYNPLLWVRGLCVPEAKEISINKSVVIILAGPLVSVILAGITFWLTFSFDMHGMLKLSGVVFFCFTVFDLGVNLIPMRRPALLYDGDEVYNDGYQLRQMLRYKMMPEQMNNAIELYNRGLYEKAAEWFDYLLASEWAEPVSYLLAIDTNYKLDRYEKAHKYAKEVALKFPERYEGHFWSGLLNGYCSQYEESFADFTKVLEIDPLNVHALENRAFNLLMMERYEEALKDIELAIPNDEMGSYAYAIRALIKFKTYNIEEGLLDIAKAIELNPDEPYAYRNLGIHHFDLGEKAKALELFRKAKDLNMYTHLIDEWIAKAS